MQANSPTVCESGGGFGMGKNSRGRCAATVYAYHIRTVRERSSRHPQKRGGRIPKSVSFTIRRIGKPATSVENVSPP